MKEHISSWALRSTRYATCLCRGPDGVVSHGDRDVGDILGLYTCHGLSRQRVRSLPTLYFRLSILLFGHRCDLLFARRE